MFSLTPIEQFRALNDKQKQALVNFEEIIQNGSPEEKQQACEVLKAYSPKTVFKLSENSSLFRRFCEKEAAHTESWIAVLQRCGYPGAKLEAHDKKESCTTYSQYVGSFLFDQYKENRETQEKLAIFQLDKACELGFLFALTERCERKLLKIKTDPTADKQRLLGHIHQDLKTLSNLYWTLGYAFATKIYLSIGQHYSEIEDELSSALSELFYKKAVEQFCCAELLAKAPESLKIADFLRLAVEQNFFNYIFEKPFRSWDSAKRDFILKFINNDESVYREQQHKAQQELSESRRQLVRIRG